jgi:hypothetical protein
MGRRRPDSPVAALTARDDCKPSNGVRKTAPRFLLIMAFGGENRTAPTFWPSSPWSWYARRDSSLQNLGAAGGHQPVETQRGLWLGPKREPRIPLMGTDETARNPIKNQESQITNDRFQIGNGEFGICDLQFVILASPAMTAEGPLRGGFSQGMAGQNNECRGLLLCEYAKHNVPG